MAKQIYSDLLVWAVIEKVRNGTPPHVIEHELGIHRTTIEDWVLRGRRQEAVRRFERKGRR